MLNNQFRRTIFKEAAEPCTLEAVDGPAPQARCMLPSERVHKMEARCYWQPPHRAPGHHARYFQSIVSGQGPTSGSMPNSLTSLRLVDTATMCLATASWPSSAVSQVLC